MIRFPHLNNFFIHVIYFIHSSNLFFPYFDIGTNKSYEVIRCINTILLIYLRTHCVHKRLVRGMILLKVSNRKLGKAKEDKSDLTNKRSKVGKLIYQSFICGKNAFFLCARALDLRLVN